MSASSKSSGSCLKTFLAFLGGLIAVFGLVVGVIQAMEPQVKCAYPLIRDIFCRVPDLTEKPELSDVKITVGQLGAWLKSQPADDSTLLGSVANQTLPVLATNISRTYYLVEYEAGKRAWVAQQISVVLTGDPSGLPVSNYVAPTPVRTPTSQPAPVTPRPSPTPLIPSLNWPEGVSVTFQEDFSGDQLWRWSSWDTKPAPYNGILTFQSSGGNAIYRTGIRENEGALMLVRFVRGRVEIGYEMGDWNTSGYRLVSIARFGNWDLHFKRGTENYNAMGAALPVTLNQWYYLLMRVGDAADFDFYLWEQGNRTNYTVKRTLRPGTSWDDLSWSMVIEILGTGEIQLDTYEELRFPADFEMPASPPSG